MNKRSTANLLSCAIPATSPLCHLCILHTLSLPHLPLWFTSFTRHFWGLNPFTCVCSGLRGGAGHASCVWSLLSAYGSALRAFPVGFYGSAVTTLLPVVVIWLVVVLLCIPTHVGISHNCYRRKQHRLSAKHIRCRNRRRDCIV